MAAIGTLIARGAFEGHLDALGVASAIALAALSGLTWNRGRIIYRERREPGMPQHCTDASRLAC